MKQLFYGYLLNGYLHGRDMDVSTQQLSALSFGGIRCRSPLWMRWDNIAAEGGEVACTV